MHYADEFQQFIEPIIERSNELVHPLIEAGKKPSFEMGVLQHRFQKSLELAKLFVASGLEDREVADNMKAAMKEHGEAFIAALEVENGLLPDYGDDLPF